MSNKIKLNTLFSLLLQFITAISGLILPQLYIRTYGSNINGMITSVTQFISYLSLVEAGIGAASIATLYRPLEEKNYLLINKILSTTRKFYIKSGKIFVFLLGLLLLFYPIITSNQIDPSLTIWMIIILSASSLCDYFILGKYRVLLTADQHCYIINFYQIIGLIVNLLITILLVYFNFGIVSVKAISTIVYIGRAMFIIKYVKKNYFQLNFNSESDEKLISQRWDALMHQIAGLIVVNSGVVLLTIFGYDFKEISVFTIYNMVIIVLNNLIMSFYNALTPTFGNIIAKNDIKILDNAYTAYESIFFIVLFTIVSVYLFLILPFMMLYTKGIVDAEYVRFDYAISGAGVILAFNLYNPAMTIINASGHYRQTRNFSVICALINVIVSIVAIAAFGPVGIFVAQICSQLFIDVSFIFYNAKYLISGSLSRTIKRLAINTTVLIAIAIIYTYLKVIEISNFFNWMRMGLLLSILFLFIYFLSNILFEKDLYNLCHSYIRLYKKNSN